MPSVMDKPTPEQINNWVKAYLEGTISKEDSQRLHLWYAALPDGPIQWPAEQNAETLKREMLEQIFKGSDLHEKKPGISRKLLLAAAAVILIAGTALLLRLSIHPSESKQLTAAVNDIIPGSTQAVLILSDGARITIDSTNTGKLATQGGTVISSNSGVLRYQEQSESNNTLIYNTYKTARAQQSPPIILSDGTKIWLNAASSLHFPTSFKKDKRIVEITGEAYFEVAHDSKRPFYVKTKSSTIRVLGTHFDVMDYPDEAYSKATLLEGSISMQSGTKSILLRPDQQARLNNQTHQIIINKVNAQEAIGWIKGELSIQFTDFQELKNQISRWYAVDVIYKTDKIPTISFSGTLSRRVNISTILAALNANGVPCHLEDKKIIIDNK